MRSVLSCLCHCSLDFATISWPLTPRKSALILSATCQPKKKRPLSPPSVRNLRSCESRITQKFLKAQPQVRCLNGHQRATLHGRLFRAERTGRVSVGHARRGKICHIPSGRRRLQTTFLHRHAGNVSVALRHGRKRHAQRQNLQPRSHAIWKTPGWTASPASTCARTAQKAGTTPAITINTRSTPE